MQSPPLPQGILLPFTNNLLFLFPVDPSPFPALSLFLSHSLCSSYLTHERDHFPIHGRQQLITLRGRIRGQRHNVIVINVHATRRFPLVLFPATGCIPRPLPQIRGSTRRPQTARASAAARVEDEQE